jgi:hypothetical protein
VLNSGLNKLITLSDSDLREIFENIEVNAIFNRLCLKSDTPYVQILNKFTLRMLKNANNFCSVILKKKIMRR